MLAYPILSPLSNPIRTNFSFSNVACQLYKTGTPNPETHGRFDSDPRVIASKTVVQYPCAKT